MITTRIILGFTFSSALRLIGLQGRQFWLALAVGIGFLVAYEMLNQIDEWRAEHDPLKPKEQK